MNLCRNCGTFATVADRLHAKLEKTQVDLGAFCSYECIEGYVAVSRNPNTPEEQQLKNDPAIFSAKTGRAEDAKVVKSQTRSKDPRQEQPDAGDIALNTLVVAFENAGKSPGDWETVVVPLMDGIRKQLTTMRARAIGIAKTAYAELEQSINGWASVRNLTDKLKTFEERDKEWSRLQVESTTVSPYDLRILYVKEKITSFRQLIRSCNMLLGPSASMKPAFARDSRGVSLMKLVMTSSMDVRLAYEGLITETEILWDPERAREDVGIYLNYDWDDTTLRKIEYAPSSSQMGRRRVQPARAGKGKPILDEPGPLVQSYYDVFVVGGEEKPRSEADVFAPFVTKARYDWILKLAGVLADLRDNVIGIQSTKVTIANFVQRLLMFGSDQWGFPNFAIMGNPGTGKTLVASKLADIGYYMGYTPVRLSAGVSNFVRLTQADFIAPYTGQTGHTTRMAILKGLGRVLAIDEAYQLVSEDGGGGGYGAEALTQIVNDIDEYRGLVSIAFLGYRDAILKNLFETNAGLRRRVSEFWELPLYTPQELYVGLLRAFERDEFVIPSHDGDARRTKQALDIVDMLTALHVRGIFDELGLSFVDNVIAAYKTTFSSAYNQADTTEQKLSMLRQMRTLDFGLLGDAIVEHAADKWDVDLMYAENIPQSEIDYETTGGKTRRSTMLLFSQPGQFARPYPPAQSPPIFRKAKAKN